MDAKLKELEDRLKKMEDAGLGRALNVDKLIYTLNNHVDRIMALEKKIAEIQKQYQEPDSVPGAQTII